MSDDASIGNRIRQIRDLLQYTQAALAERIGRSRAWLANIESGRRDIKLKDAAVIARTLGISLDTLVGDEPTDDKGEGGDAP